jgi:hypothetical protein
VEIFSCIRMPLAPSIADKSILFSQLFRPNLWAESRWWRDLLQLVCRALLDLRPLSICHCLPLGGALGRATQAEADGARPGVPVGSHASEREHLAVLLDDVVPAVLLALVCDHQVPNADRSPIGRQMGRRPAAAACPVTRAPSAQYDNGKRSHENAASGGPARDQARRDGHAQAGGRPPDVA